MNYLEKEKKLQEYYEIKKLLEAKADENLGFSIANIFTTAIPLVYVAGMTATLPAIEDVIKNPSVIGVSAFAMIGASAMIHYFKKNLQWEEKSAIFDKLYEENKYEEMDSFINKLNEKEKLFTNKEENVLPSKKFKMI